MAVTEEEVQIRMEQEIRSIQDQLKIKDYSSAARVAEEMKCRYKSDEEISLLTKLKFKELHIEVILEQLNAQFAVVEEKLLKELKIPKIDLTKEYLAELNSIIDKINRNGGDFQKYQERVDRLKERIAKIGKLHPHLISPQSNLKKSMDVQEIPSEPEEIVPLHENLKANRVRNPTPQTFVDRSPRKIESDHETSGIEEKDHLEDQIIDRTEILTPAAVSEFRNTIAKESASKLSHKARLAASKETPNPKIPLHIDNMIKSASYKPISIKPKSDHLVKISKIFQIYLKESKTPHAVHHHFLLVRYSHSTYDVGAIPKYRFESGDEQLPEEDKNSISINATTADFYDPFAEVIYLTENIQKLYLNTPKPNAEFLRLIQELYSSVFSSSKLSVQLSPVYIRFDDQPLIFNFSTVCVFPDATSFSQNIPGTPQCGLFYAVESTLPFFLDYFNDKYYILNTMRREAMEEYLNPQANITYFQYSFHAGIWLAFFTLIFGLALFFNWAPGIIVGMVLSIGTTLHISYRSKNRFVGFYRNHPERYFYSYTHFNQEEIDAITSQFLGSKQKDVFIAEHSMKPSLKNSLEIQSRPRESKLKPHSGSKTARSVSNEKLHLHGRLSEFFTE